MVSFLHSDLQDELCMEKAGISAKTGDDKETEKSAKEETDKQYETDLNNLLGELFLPDLL